MINKKVGVSFVFLFSIIFLLSFVFAGSCRIDSKQNCEATGDFVILGLSDTTNAHAQSWNAGGICDGVVTACNEVDVGSFPPASYIINCEAQEGCKFAGTCKNDAPLFATPCNQITNPAQCGETEMDAQFGCAWIGPELYPWALCCDVDPGNRFCVDPEPQTPGDASSDNVLVLSSDSNAHAEFAIEVESAYDAAGNRICYPNVACSSRPEGTSCPEELTEILSLSGITNAHVGAPGEYDNKICCNVYYDGESLCEGGAPSGAPPLDAGEECDSGAHCTNLCTCEDFYDADGEGGCVWDQAGFNSYWSSTYDDAINLRQIQDGVLSGLYVGQDTIYLGLVDYAGRWSTGDPITIEIWEDDLDFGTGWGDDPIRVGVEALEVEVLNGEIGLVVANWSVIQADLDKTNGDYKDFYFKAFDDLDGPDNPFEISSSLELTSVNTIICSAIGLCMDYRNEQDCSNDAGLCQVGSFSVNLNNPNVDCSDPNVNCECFWDDSAKTCNSMWGDLDGNCVYSEDSEDDCGDMFLTYSFLGSWNQGGENVEKGCINGENVVPCPAKVQLPFFNIYNTIAVIVIIVIIYLVLSLKKNKSKTFKSRKKK